MKHKRRLLLGLLCTCLIAGGALYLSLPREPAYQGRTLSEWLTELDGYVHPSKALKAEEAVRHMGPDIIPYLIAILENRDSPLEKKFFHFLRKQRAAPIAPLPEYRRHDRALNALLALDTNAAPVVPILISWTENQTPAVRQKRFLAFRILRELGPIAAGAVPSLVRGLTDKDAEMRSSAALTLGHISGKPDLVIPALIRCLGDPVATVRGNSMYALSTYGAEAKAAVPALEQALNDVNANNQHLALSALRKIEPARRAGTPQWQAIQTTMPVTSP